MAVEVTLGSVAVHEDSAFILIVRGVTARRREEAELLLAHAESKRNERTYTTLAANIPRALVAHCSMPSGESSWPIAPMLRCLRSIMKP